jgi:hypothetical protein
MNILILPLFVRTLSTTVLPGLPSNFLVTESELDAFNSTLSRSIDGLQIIALQAQWTRMSAKTFSAIASGIYVNISVVKKMDAIERILLNSSEGTIERLFVRKSTNSPYMGNMDLLIDQGIASNTLSKSVIRALISRKTIGCYRVNELVRIPSLNPMGLILIARACKHLLSVHTRLVHVSLLLEKVFPSTNILLPAARIDLIDYERSGSLFGKAMYALSNLNETDCDISKLSVYIADRREVPVSQFVSHALFRIYNVSSLGPVVKHGNIKLLEVVEGEKFRPFQHSMKEKKFQALRQLGRLLGLGIRHNVPLHFPLHEACLQAIIDLVPSNECPHIHFVLEGIYDVVPFGLLSWFAMEELNNLFTGSEFVVDLGEFVDKFEFFDSKICPITQIRFKKCLFQLSVPLRTKMLIKAGGTPCLNADEKIFVSSGQSVAFDPKNRTMSLRPWYLDEKSLCSALLRSLHTMTFS